MSNARLRMKSHIGDGRYIKTHDKTEHNHTIYGHTHKRRRGALALPTRTNRRGELQAAVRCQAQRDVRNLNKSHRTTVHHSRRKNTRQMHAQGNPAAATSAAEAAMAAAGRRYLLVARRTRVARRHRKRATCHDRRRQ